MSTIIYRGTEEALDTLEQILPREAKRARVEGELRVTEDDGKDFVQEMRVEPCANKSVEQLEKEAADGTL